jgi:phenylacetate-CoA ligase
VLRKWRELERTQWYSSSELKALQTRRLTALLEHAYRTVPYYQRAFDAAGIGPGDVRGPDDLRKLPLLNKETIQAERGEMCSVAFRSGQRLSNSTGGSTGTPLRFYQDWRQRDWGSANKLRCNRWAGWDFGKSVLRLWGHSRDLEAARAAIGKLRDFVLGEHILDAFHFTDRAMDELVHYIRRKKPRFVVAYSSILAHLVDYLEERQVLDLPAPDGIVTSADMLYPHQRAAIERMFGAAVYNRYGCREVDTIAAECGEHEGMHICAERLVVEFLDENEHSVAPGQPGRVIITDLFSYAMPFVRYDIGDLGTPSAKVCRCGRGLSLMSELTGRMSDVLVTPEGAYVSVTALSTILPQVPGVQETQFLQRAVDWLQVKVVRRPEYGAESEGAFRRHIAQLFGSQMRVTFDYVDDIPKTATGKARLSVGQDSVLT